MKPPIEPPQISAPPFHRSATAGRSRRWLTGLAVWLVAAALAAADAPPWDRLTAGAYDVGFKVEEHYDYSRPYRLDVPAASDEHARPIRMFIWYPARHRPPDRPFAYGEYLALSDLRAAPWTTAAETRRQIVEDTVARSAEPEALRQVVPRWLATPTRAVRDAEVAEGRFPLLVFAPGGTTPGYLHAGLCEYLASHGYVAVAVASLPRRDGERWPFDLTGIDLHLRDQEIAISHLLEWPSVDRDQLGLVSWSVGGVSHALLAMRNPDVDAVVSLDGATGYAYGQEMIRSSIFFAEEGFTAAFLQATGGMPGRYEVEKDFSLYESLTTGMRYLLTVEPLAHADFAASLLFERSLTDPEGSWAARDGYAVLAEAVRDFLDAHVRRKPGAGERLHAFLDDPAREGVLTTQWSTGDVAEDIAGDEPPPTCQPATEPNCGLTGKCPEGYHCSRWEETMYCCVVSPING